MEIGQDVFIDEFVRIKRPNLVEIGSHVAIDFGFYCTTALQIGDYIHISPYVTVCNSMAADVQSARSQ